MGKERCKMVSNVKKAMNKTEKNWGKEESHKMVLQCYFVPPCST